MLVLAAATVMAVPLIGLWAQSGSSRWTGTQTPRGICVAETGVLGMIRIREWTGGPPREQLILTERPALASDGLYVDLKVVPDDRLSERVNDLAVRVGDALNRRGMNAFVAHGVHDVAKLIEAHPNIMIPKVLEWVKHSPCVETWNGGFPFVFVSHVRAHVADDAWISLPRVPGAAGWTMPVDVVVQAYDLTVMGVPAVANVACVLGVGLLWRSGWRTLRGRWRRSRGRCPICSFPTHKCNRCPECGDVPVSA